MAATLFRDRVHVCFPLLQTGLLPPFICWCLSNSYARGIIIFIGGFLVGNFYLDPSWLATDLLHRISPWTVLAEKPLV